MAEGSADKNCPTCGAISPDYCQLAKCEWTMTEPPDLSATQHLLADVNQTISTKLFEAFNRAAGNLGAKNADAMWAVALLGAKVIAGADMGPLQQRAATDFGNLLRIALPMMIAGVERAKREAEGQRPFDG